MWSGEELNGINERDWRQKVDQRGEHEGVRLEKKQAELSFSLYPDSGKKAFTLWPNIGPHIVEFPSDYAIYIREDKAKSGTLTCKGVGEYPVKYEWKDRDGVRSSFITENTILRYLFPGFFPREPFRKSLNHY